METEKLYFIISYYNYTFIKEPENFKKDHYQYCKKLGILGRIIISHEGINGTLSGLKKDVAEYMQYLKKIKNFEKVEFKIDSYHEHVFPRLSFKVRKEIVSLKLEEDFFPEKNSENYLNSKDFLKFLQKENKEDFVILDVRNNYEYNLGHFKNAINPNINHFRDLPKWLEKNLDLFENKKVLTYCTGGVRCEKVSLFLKSKKIHKVYQLKGGIIEYSQDTEVQGQLFEGKVYVFDKRISNEVNKKEHVIVGKDFFDQTPCERYINCSNPECNKQILCSVENEIKYLGSCSKKCMENKRNTYFYKKNLNKEIF
ncbi:MAG: rhodanese-related sulfurtransferase [Candidatus Phytoplasma stylosanthis]|nr:rhodanese-related sulfurtransferase [Candidatus Phytoplasma stylosanthis]